MSANRFGTLFTFTSFGESHGPAVGCVVDGCPSRLPLSAADIQPHLDRRRPGQSPYVSPRNEVDKVRILSGVYEGMTTGHPILLLVENTDQRSRDYKPIHDIYRPGHADAVYDHKYGIRDPRGGGRSSARETLARVAAGAVARQVLAHSQETAAVAVRAGLVGLGNVLADASRWDDSQIDANPFFCPDAEAVPAMRAAVETAIANRTSLGGIVEIRAQHVPPGLGEPVYDKLDSRIGSACLGLNAVKGVEIGDGFAAAGMDGLGMNDQMRPPKSGRFADAFATNHAGGILGGISTGQDIIVRCAIKPTPSIGATQLTVDKHFHETEINIAGRHDPAVCIRAVPVLEATLAYILADFLLLARARGGLRQTTAAALCANHES